MTTIAGRRRYLDAINSDDHALKSQAERQVSSIAIENFIYIILVQIFTVSDILSLLKAINTVIQGSAADMMKTAMINMNKNIRELWKGPVNERPQML